MELIFATNNPGKLKEAREILEGKVVLLGQDEAGIAAEAEETGLTLAENALLKARLVYSLAGGRPCIADDTGLEVDALGGAPGIRTARFGADIAAREGRPAPAHHDFDANINALLSELKKHPGEPRTARFHSVVALIMNGEEYLFEGIMPGRIAEERGGDGGFGYDPVFIADAFPDRTVASLPEQVKNTISHRGLALGQMAQWLKKQNLI